MQQTVFRPQPNTSQQSSRHAQSPSIIFIGLTLFALAGLMIGFAVGIFTHRKSGQTANNNKGPVSTVISHPQTSPTSSTVKTTPLGCPWNTYFSSATQIADGNTPYVLTEQAMDQTYSICQKNNHPLHVAGITFKLWLINGLKGDAKLKLPGDPTKTLTNISDPITGTVQNQSFPELSYLTFDPTTKQVQTSNDQGQATWKYTIAPTAPPGNYDLVILTDWVGQRWNWSWLGIQITKAGDN
jgi:hypothetical protein